MVRTLNFDLVKNAIENAKKSHNFHHLDHFEYILSELLIKVGVVITNSIISRRSDYVLLRKAKELYFLIISVQN